MKRCLVILILLTPVSLPAQDSQPPRDESFFNQGYVNGSENEDHAPRGTEETEQDQEFKRRDLPSQEVAGSSAVKKGFERPQSRTPTDSEWNRRRPVIYPGTDRKPPRGIFENFEADFSLKDEGSR